MCNIDKQLEGTLPAYVFSLLAIYYLQQCTPPVLPVLHEVLLWTVVTYFNHTTGYVSQKPAYLVPVPSSTGPGLYTRVQNGVDRVSRLVRVNESLDITNHRGACQPHRHEHHNKQVQYGCRQPCWRSPPNFRPISVAAKWLHRSRCHLVWS